ncbi:MAG: Holliday junction branch migration protein RuvA [Bacilli bacterium]|jgi:Holliday junction DNA helicase RuvA
MIYSLNGTIVENRLGYLVVDVGNIAYQVYVARPDYFAIGSKTVIYTYQVVREDEIYLCGFRDLDDRDMFMKLITVKGIGPRTALGAMATTTALDLVTAISANNITFLKKLPGIGAKAAAQIILDLKGQLAGGGKGNPHQYEDVRNALKQLGFRVGEIDRVLASINIINGDSETILKEALAQLRKVS